MCKIIPDMDDLWGTIYVNACGWGEGASNSISTTEPAQVVSLHSAQDFTLEDTKMWILLGYTDVWQ